MNLEYFEEIRVKIKFEREMMQSIHKNSTVYQTRLISRYISKLDMLLMSIESATDYRKLLEYEKTNSLQNK